MVRCEENFKKETQCLLSSTMSIANPRAGPSIKFEGNDEPFKQ